MPNAAVQLARVKLKAEREERNWEREKMVYDRLLTPNVTRLALMMGIIGYSTWVTRSKTEKGPVESALAFALPGIGLPMLAADAGIRDKYALGAISAAGLAYAGLSALQGGSLTDWIGNLPPLGAAGSVLDQLRDMLTEGSGGLY